MALTDDKGAITHIISQTDIVRFMVQHKAKLGGPALQKVSDLALCSGQVGGAGKG